MVWSLRVTLVPLHILSHGTLLLTERLLSLSHTSRSAEAGLAGAGARSRGAGRAHKGAAEERLRARASGRWSPALDWSGVGHAGNAFQGAAFGGPRVSAEFVSFPSGLKNQNSLRLRRSCLLCPVP